MAIKVKAQNNELIEELQAKLEKLGMEIIFDEEENTSDQKNKKKNEKKQ